MLCAAFGKFATTSTLPEPAALRHTRMGIAMFRLLRKLSDFGIGRFPVGSILSCIVLLAMALVAAFVYWNAFDMFPRWVDKVVILFGIAALWAVHLREQDRKRQP